MKTKLLFGSALAVILLGAPVFSGSKAWASEDCDRHCDRPSSRYHDPEIDMAMHSRRKHADTGPRDLHADTMLRDEQSDWYAHHSTPQEMAETRDLNRGAMRGAVAPAQVAAYRQQQSQYQSEQADYAALRHNYDDQMRQYAVLRDRYRAERAAYHRDPWYALRDDRVRGPWIPGRYDDLGGWGIRTVDGRPLGTVTAIARSPEGRFEAVRVAVNQGGVAWIDASDLRFDPYARVATTDIEFGDVRQMAAERY